MAALAGLSITIFLLKGKWQPNSDNKGIVTIYLFIIQDLDGFIIQVSSSFGIFGFLGLGAVEPCL